MPINKQVRSTSSENMIDFSVTNELEQHNNVDITTKKKKKHAEGVDYYNVYTKLRSRRSCTTNSIIPGHDFFFLRVFLDILLER